MGQDGSEQEPALDPGLRAPQAGSAPVTPASFVTGQWECKVHPGSRDFVTMSHSPGSPPAWEP